MRDERVFDGKAGRVLRSGLGLAAVLTAIGFASLPAPGSAQQIAPPGNSAADQYTETYPTSRGDAPTEGIGGETPKQALGSPQAERLEALGEDGRAAAELAASTSPASSEAGRSAAAGGSGPDPAGQGSPANGGRSDEASGSSALGEIASTGVSSSGEMGIVLPLIGLAALAAAAALIWRRRRQLA